MRTGYAWCVPRNVQVRNVPDELHAALRQRARDEGITLSQLVMRELRAAVGRPNRADLLRELERRGPGVALTGDEIAAVVRDGRPDR